MQRCFQLARMGQGRVAPNPIVGAVLVYENKIIGEGYHQRYGGPHAEVNCIESVMPGRRHLIPKSHLYVSLEPCAHFGKTPPCADLIIRNEIKKVTVGCLDPFAKVAGKGIEKLQDAGIEVALSLLNKEALDLNKRFFTFHTKKRPYIILKWAQTGDGKMAGKNGARLHISNAFTNRLVHRWRSEEQGILVGTDTALLDDPLLTTRLWPGADPVRLVIDRNLRLTPTLKLFDKTAKTIVLNNQKGEEGEAANFYKLAAGDNAVQPVCNALVDLDIQSVLVEGGAALLQSFINEATWDEARVITNNQLLIGEGLAAPQLKNAALISEEQVQSDTISFYVKVN